MLDWEALERFLIKTLDHGDEIIFLTGMRMV